MKSLALVVLLLGLVGAAIVGVQAFDRRGAAVEASVRRYATAITNSDLDGALAEIAPPLRDRWRDWIAGQLGNVYEVRGVAVRARSITSGPDAVTVVMDVNRGYAGEFYQPTPRVGVAEIDGREYLTAPLLAQP